MDHKVTIQDIATMVNVSKSSVSRYLNDGYVSRENAEKIKEAIEKTGFQTNFFARRLKTKCSRLIGIVLPRIDSVSVGKLLAGINRELEANDYQGLILSSELSREKELSNLYNLSQQGVDGIIVNSLAITDQHTEMVKAMQIPVVFTGQKKEQLHCVKADDERAGRILGEYFGRMGHKNVVFLGVGEADKAVGIERKQGFSAALREVSGGCDIHFLETGFSFQNAYAKGGAVMDCNPTAIACATDNIALGILRYLHERRIAVPEEISVAGFGGYEIGTVSYPALTTVSFDYELIGMKTAQGLLSLIGGKTLNQMQSELPLTLIERESVRALFK